MSASGGIKHCDKMMSLALLALSAVAVSSAPTGDQCPAVLLATVKPNSPFDMVGHSLHSMTVEDLQMFEPTANEFNHVPTVNMDLQSPNVILSHAPKRPATGHDFLNDGMASLDVILSSMDKTNWDVNSEDLLGRITHLFHMRELWTQTLARYAQVKESAPSDQVCRCVMDVQKNGIKDRLEAVATELRKPAWQTTAENKKDVNETPTEVKSTALPTGTSQWCGCTPEGCGCGPYRPIPMFNQPKKPEKASKANGCVPPYCGAYSPIPIFNQPEKSKKTSEASGCVNCGGHYRVIPMFNEPKKPETAVDTKTSEKCFCDDKGCYGCGPYRPIPMFNLPNNAKNGAKQLTANEVKLDNSDAWHKWTLKNTRTSPDLHYNTALFLYCALNKPNME